MPHTLKKPSLGALALMLAFAGCGESVSSNSAAEPRTVTVTKTVPADPQPPKEQPSSDHDQAATQDEPVTEESSAPSGSGKVRVPDVVGEDHQLAQDTMQAAGLYNLAEEDASGQGRMLLYDRNWTVVSQSPTAGSMVSEDRTVTLRAEKDGE